MDSRRRSVIGGGYLLSHFRSTIGVAGFNFSVRNGKRWSPRAVATLVRSGRPSVSPLSPVGGRLPPRGRRLGSVVAAPAAVMGRKRRLEAGCDPARLQTSFESSPEAAGKLPCLSSTLPGERLRRRFSVCFRGTFVPAERVRAISIARLPASPLLHLRPIDVVVFDGPVRRSYLGGGFALRCFQRLSWPDAATRRCGWRHNRCTGGPSDTVLSY